MRDERDWLQLSATQQADVKGSGLTSHTLLTEASAPGAVLPPASRPFSSSRKAKRRHILPAVGMIRDGGEVLPALSGFAVPDELHLRIEAIEEAGSRSGELLKPPIHTSIAIELDPPTLKVRIVTA